MRGNLHHGSTLNESSFSGRRNLEGDITRKIEYKAGNPVPHKVGNPLKHSPVIPHKVVILYTNKRSGSTFLGEMFNQNPNVFYLFEPLFPYTRSCDVLHTRRLDALSQIAECNFANLKDLYAEAFRITRHTDHFAQCRANNLCFAERHEPLLERYRDVYFNDRKIFNRSDESVLPLKLSILSDMCTSSKLVVYKILRLCDLSSLQKLFHKWRQRQDLKVKVIHLLRDPRAILSSRMQVISHCFSAQPIVASLPL